MKLYSFSPTPNNRKVEAFIKHFDLPVEIHSMGFREQENRTEAYLRMNPMGKAPLLVDGDFCLWESNAILCYLATLHPETGMLPDDPQGRADCDRWLYWQAFHLINTIIATRSQERLRREGHRPQYRCPQRSTRGSGIRPRRPVHRRFRPRPVSARSTRTSDRLRFVSQRAGLAGPLQPARRHRRDGVQTKKEMIANALRETSIVAPSRPGGIDSITDL